MFDDEDEDPRDHLIFMLKKELQDIRYKAPNKSYVEMVKQDIENMRTKVEQTQKQFELEKQQRTRNKAALEQRLKEADE